jgi:hypothetical protein
MALMRDAPNFLLQIIPHVDATPRICELVEYYLEDIILKAPISLDGRHSGDRAKRGSPEPMNTALWNMASGLAAVRRPGMTSCCG